MRYRLKNERVRALKAKERFAQAAAGIGSDTVVRTYLDSRRDINRNTKLLFINGMFLFLPVQRWCPCWG